MDKNIILEHIRYINQNNGMPEEAAKEIEALIDVIFADPDFEAKCDFLAVDFWDLHGKSIWSVGEKEAEVYDLAKEKGVNGDLLCLVMAEIVSLQAKKNFLEKGFSEEHYLAQTYDIAIWAKTCMNMTGHWGINRQYGWVTNSLRGITVSRLGRLQFELVPMNGSGIGQVINGIEIKEDTPMINIHIPEGDSLTKEKRLDAYKRAYKFYNCEGMAAFACSSWLLYPKQEEFLPATSNILDFMHDFRITYSEDNNGDMWRVFGSAWRPKDNNWDLLPENTGLQRAYKAWLKKGGSGGEAFGIFLFDGEKIYK